MADPPIACDLGTLDDDERNLRAQILADLRRALRGFAELQDGFEVILDLNHCSRVDLERLIEFENRCCSFLHFEPTYREEGALVRITGPPGSKAILAAELGLANWMPE